MCYCSAFVQYNEASFTPAQIEGSDSKVLITSHGRLPDGRYLDPRTQQIFKFDHLRKEISDVSVCMALPASSCFVSSCCRLQAAPAPGPEEGLRLALQTAASEYVADHYHSGTTTVSSFQSANEGFLEADDGYFPGLRHWRLSRDLY